jgi:ribosomal protein S12 methylthiotransferase accessory factor YcaO
MVGEFQRINRPPGYELPDVISGMLQTKSSNFKTEGFSEAKWPLAETKAKSESLERTVMQEWSKFSGIADTSNGWACHTNIEAAIENAIFELVERDVALTTWEDGLPYLLLPEAMWPLELQLWNKRKVDRPEYSILKVALCSTKNSCCISVFLFNQNGNCVVGHASSDQMSEAILAAFNECLRAAHSALRLEYFTEVIHLHSPNLPKFKYSPGAHSLAYAYSQIFPEHMQFKQVSANEIQQLWQTHQKVISEMDTTNLEILGFKILDRVVVRVRSACLRQIYWGKAPSESFLKNKSPHNVG